MNGSLIFSDVFVAGADGVHTYRIPSLLVASGGTLLAFCEARKTSGNDASPTDMVLKRSTDHGWPVGATTGGILHEPPAEGFLTGATP